MKFRNCGLFLLLSCLAFPGTVYAGSLDELSPSPAPSTAKTVEGFKDKDWNIETVARGDLDRDGRSDCALIVSYNGSETCKLIVALQNADGTFRKVAESEDAVTSDCGKATKVFIKKNVLRLHHFCGHRNLYDTDYKYELKDGRLFLIGYTNAVQDPATLKSTASVDVNFLTGDIAGEQKQGDGYKKVRFMEILSPGIATAEPQVTDWSAPAVWLNPKSSCPTISLQSLHNDKVLFLRAQLQNAEKLTEKEVRLVDAKGQTIAPLTIKTTTYGYVLASYDLQNASIAAALNEAKTISGSTDPLLRLTVEVTPTGCKQTFKTGKYEPGGILFTHATGALKLSDIQVQGGELVHPFLWPTPSSNN